MKQNITIILLLLVSSLFAQVSFKAKAPRVVSQGERFYLQYTVNADGNSPQFPNLSNFNILSGPNQSQSQSVSIVNGKVSQNISLTYTFLLSANKTGKFTIAPASISVNGKRYKSNPVSIEVVKGNNSNNSQTANNSQSQQGNTQTQASVNSKKIYVEVIPSKRSVYKGEQFTATIKIYTKYDIAGFEDINFPSWDGFYTQEIPTSDQVRLQRENVNGQIYYTAVMQKMILQAQKTGKVTINPAKFDVVILKRTQRRSRSIFDDFFNSGYQRYRVSIKSRPVTINVKPLPPAPDNFDGAIGSFKFSAKLDKNNVKVNDAVSLKLRISGNGNLKLIPEPKVNFPPDFEMFGDPKIENNIKNTSNGSIGNKTFEFVFSPRHPGEYQIPGIEFTYFDPKLKKYKTIKTEDFNIHVEKGDGDTTAFRGFVNANNKEELKYLGEDIRYINTGDLNLKRSSNYLFGSNGFWAAYILSTLMFIILFIVKRKQIKEHQNVKLLRNRKANKIAKKHLKNAAKSMKANDKDKFYNDVTKALWGYISDKLGIPAAELTKDNIKENLIKHNVDESLVDEFIDLLNTCEFEHYAPSPKQDRLSEIYKLAESLINKFEKQIKK